MRSLRFRLILNQILPLLVIIPLAGAALIYLIETQVLLETLSSNLTRQAVLVAEITSENPLIWFDDTLANDFTVSVGSQLGVQVLLIDPSGRIFASNSLESSLTTGKTFQSPEWTNAVSGKITTRVFSDAVLKMQVSEIMVPVINSNSQLVGVVMMLGPLSSQAAQFYRLRTYVFLVLAAGLILGILLGWRLAAQISRPIRQTTEAVHALAEGRQAGPLQEVGPDELRSLTRAFNILNSQLSTLEQNRQRLLANLAHEIGRPLGALLSAVQAMQGGAQRNPRLRKELLAGMEEEIRVMQSLASEVTHMHGISLGPLELKRSYIRISNWLPPILATGREAARAKKLKWSTELTDPLPDAFMDPERMAQAIGNLVQNAVKFTSRGEICFRVSSEKDVVEFAVSDTGPGIAPDEISRIFIPFFRGHAGGRFPQGMGLGLSIARDIAEAHGGTLEAVSDPGKGATFIMRIPLHLSAPETAQIRP